MILAFYGGAECEDDLIDELGASAKAGTSPDAIERAFRKRGFSCREIVNLHTLKSARHPVIVDYQDHGPRGTDYAAVWDHGHYAVVVNADRQRITLADPSSKRPRRHLKTADFLARWHDIGFGLKPKFYVQWGLSVGPKK